MNILFNGWRIGNGWGVGEREMGRKNKAKPDGFALFTE